MGEDWAARFPRLFAPAHIDYANVDVIFGTQDFPDELISRLHCVATDPAGRVIVCRTQDWRFLPGGTREPGESLAETAARNCLRRPEPRSPGQCRSSAASWRPASIRSRTGHISPIPSAVGPLR